MSIELVTKFQPYVDELFKNESKRDLLTNQDFDWTGAHTVKIYKISTSQMNDYDRSGQGENWSRYGAIEALSATTQEMTLKRDRSFTFAIDKLDDDETARQLQAAAALARQLLDAGFDLSFGLRYNKESFDITPTERRYRETDAL